MRPSPNGYNAWLQYSLKKIDKSAGCSLGAFFPYNNNSGSSLGLRYWDNKQNVLLSFSALEKLATSNAKHDVIVKCNASFSALKKLATAHAKHDVIGDEEGDVTIDLDEEDIVNGLQGEVLTVKIKWQHQIKRVAVNSVKKCFQSGIQIQFKLCIQIQVKL